MKKITKKEFKFGSGGSTRTGIGVDVFQQPQTEASTSHIRFERDLNDGVGVDVFQQPQTEASTIVPETELESAFPGAMIDFSHLPALVDEANLRYKLELNLVRGFLDCFESVLSGVPFRWDDIVKEPQSSLVLHVPYIPEPFNTQLVDRVKVLFSDDLIARFVSQSFSTIVYSLFDCHWSDSQEPLEPAEKSDVSLFFGLSTFIRSRPRCLTTISLLLLEKERCYQRKGINTIPLTVWIIAQASQVNVRLGLYLWANNLLPHLPMLQLLSLPDGAQSGKLILMLVDKILAKPEAQQLVKNPVWGGVPLISSRLFEILLVLRFPETSATEEESTRFGRIYTLLKEVALAGALSSINPLEQMFKTSLRLAGKGNTVLAKEAIAIVIWSLTKLLECWGREWLVDDLHEGIIEFLQRLVNKWNYNFLKMASSSSKKAMKLSILRIFILSLNSVGNGNPVSARRAEALAIWSLLNNVACWKLWYNLCKKNPEASVALLETLVKRWNDRSLTLPSSSSKATKQFIQRIFIVSLRLAGKGNSVLATEAGTIAVWSLTEKVVCLKHWNYLYDKNLEASVVLLKTLVKIWKDHSLLKLLVSPSESDLRETIKSFRVKNEKAITEGGANASLYKEADRSCRVISGILSLKGTCVRAAVVISGVLSRGSNRLKGTCSVIKHVDDKKRKKNREKEASGLTFRPSSLTKLFQARERMLKEEREAAFLAMIDFSDLMSSLHEAKNEILRDNTSPTLLLRGFLECFDSVLSGVPFIWEDVYQPPLSTVMLDVPCIPEPVNTKLLNCVGLLLRDDLLSGFVSWSFSHVVDSVFHCGWMEGEEPLQFTQKSDVSLLFGLAMILRSKPHLLTMSLSSLREKQLWYQRRGIRTSSLTVWMIAQASQDSVHLGLYSWAHNLLPLLGCNDQPMALILRLIDKILAKPRAQTELVRAPFWEEEPLIPPPSFEILLVLRFPATSAREEREEAEKRFGRIYTSLKDVALAGASKREALIQQIFTVCLRLAGNENPVLAKEAAAIAIWSLTENVVCWERWYNLCKENVQASVVLLYMLVEKWNDDSLELPSRKAMKLGIHSRKAFLQQIFTFSLSLAGKGNPVLAREAAAVAIWSLTKKLVCWKLWYKICKKNLEDSVALLKGIVEKWNDQSLRLSSSTSRAMKKFIQQIFIFSLRLAGEGNSVLATEAATIAIWSLTENVVCWKRFNYIYDENLEASVALLKTLVKKWKEHYLKLLSSPSESDLRETMESFRVKNEKAITEGGANASLYKEADRYCKVISGRLSRGSSSLIGTCTVAVALWWKLTRAVVIVITVAALLYLLVFGFNK